MATKTTARRKKTKTKTPQKRSVNARSEAKYLIIVAFGVLMALSLYIEGSMGFVGRFLATLIVGLFGFGAYVLPVLVIGFAGYGLFSSVRKRNRVSVISTTLLMQVTCLFWVVIALVHISPPPEQYNLGLWAYLQFLFNEASASNGGVFGGLLGNVLHRILRAGAYIVLVLAILVLFVLMTGRSLSQGIARIWDELRMRSRRDDYDDYDEEEFFDDEEEEPEERPMPARRGLKPLPIRPGKKPKIKPKNGNVLDIRDAAGRREGKILLFHEEIPHNNKANKVLHFKAPEKPEIVVEPEEEEIVEAEKIVKKMVEEVIFEEREEAEEIEEAEETEEKDITLKGLIDEALPEPKIVKPVKKEEQNFDSAFPKYEDYQFPPLDLLSKSPENNPTESRTQILENSRILEETLRSFKVEAKVIEVSVGPTVTRYDLAPGAGVKVATIANLSNDLALSLAAQGIRIEAPIPGKSAVGIEIPNKEPQAVYLRDILEDELFTKFPSALAFGVGKDIAGSPVVTDVAKMPHLLIAGATGAGKSVCINTLIASILFKSHPDEVKMLMVDPKVVELSMYNGIPHLLVPVVTDPKKASDALQWAVSEMEMRYGKFADVGVRDLKAYNHYAAHVAEPAEEDEEEVQTMPQIIIIIDELSDLMMTCKGAVEESICRLAQKARAAGIHMVLATQRPSVDVITGLIKANVPSRLAFAVSSGTDSRTVLDMTGAEKLLGKGDMLFLPVGQNKPTRLQGGFISDKEVESVVNFLKRQTVTVYPPELVEQVTSATRAVSDEEMDEFFLEAAEFLIEKGKGSTSMLQRRFRIGYNRASRLMENLEARGIVGPEDGVKPRKITITWEEYQAEYGR